MIERMPLNKKNIHAKRDLSMVSEDGRWDGDRLEGGSVWCCGGLDCLSFDSGDVGPVDN
jgi:hypothetical protein